MYRIKELLASGRSLFHTNDLAVLWGLTNKHTLHVAIHRYIQRGVLYKVYRGLYATKPIVDINPNLLGMAIIHTYCYLSCERVLADEGVIPQQIHGLTFVAGSSKTITVADTEFHYRQLHPRFLFHPAGVFMDPVGVRRATTPRAIADLLYFNPRYAIDTGDLVDWSSVKSVQKEVGYI